MVTNSRIEWTQSTWNPVTGCSKVGPGCDNCYAERMAKRLQSMGVRRYRNGFKVTLQPDILQIPLKWKKPRRIFVNSMSDLFHEEIPDEYILETFGIMNRADQHVFQVLTKRSKRLLSLSSRIDWTSNIWIGVTVENDSYKRRVDDLRKIQAAIRFVSAEPLIGPIVDLDLSDIHWIIVGGESGPRSRTMNPEWARMIRDKCVLQGVPFFFKQWGGNRRKRNGRTIDGNIWNEYPHSYSVS